MNQKEKSYSRLLYSMKALPLWVKIWLVILMGANLGSIWFLDSGIGRWTAITFLVIGAFNIPMALLQNGLTRMLSFPHLIWIGLLIYLWKQLFGPDAIEAGTLLYKYGVSVFVVNSISVAFDLMECWRWLKGNRGLISEEKNSK